MLKKIFQKHKAKLFLFLLSLGLLYIYLYSLPIPVNPHRSSMEDGEFRIAHRCGRSIFPENTLFACKSIYEKNLADILEMDVHLTKDSHLVVIHDSTVDRTTNGKGKVEDLTYAEILSLDAGYAFTQDGKSFPFRGQGIKILELEEFFKTLPQAKYYIEIKVKQELASQILSDLIEKYKLQDRAYIGSVGDKINQRLTDISHGRHIVYSGLVSTLKWYLSYLIEIRGAVSPPQVLVIPDLPRIMPINANLMKAIKEQNIKIHVFTINERKRIEELKSLGVDGVMSDNPNFFNE